jgi:hypothetical protein
MNDVSIKKSNWLFTVIIQYRFLISIVLVCFACYFAFFWNLDALSIQTYDEGRQAVNAIEMAQNGNYLVSYFNGKPDTWSTKPPLLIWLIVASMKLVGYNEMAVRLPSAIAASATVLLLFLFSKAYLKDLKAAVISSSVLLTTYGYVERHVARTGDFDALLTFWMTSYFLAYFLYLNEKKNKGWYLYASAITIALSILTKGIAGLIPLPALFIYTLYKKKLKSLLANSSFYISIAIILIFGLGYYFLREWFNPGYIKLVIGNELTGRYLNEIENNTQDFWFYLREMFKSFIPWVIFLPPTFVVTQFSKNRLVNSLGIYCLLYLSTHFLIISIAKTKLSWYSAPEYPVAALLIGLGLSEALNLFVNSYSIKNFKLVSQATGVKQNIFEQRLIAAFLILTIMLIPALKMASKIKGTFIYNRLQDPPEIQLGYYLRHLKNSKPDLKRFSVIDGSNVTIGGRRAHTLFYVQSLNLNGYSITLSSPETSLNDQEIIVTCFSVIIEGYKKKYKLKTLDSNHGKSCKTFIVEKSNN